MTRQTSRHHALSEYVEIRSNFRRSVLITSDWSNRTQSSDYIVTPAINDFTEQILREIKKPFGDRAWTLTGPFGAGKSAFALFLANLLSRQNISHPDASRLVSRFKSDIEQFTPILIQADRKPLRISILEAINQNEEIDSLILSKAEYLLSEEVEPAACVRLVLDAASTTKGIVMIVDELGKYLEYAADDTSEDVYFLQQLAESVARAQTPILFIGILHSGFADYFAKNSHVRQSEWQKVQGRFRDIPFNLPNDQMLDLVSKSIISDFPSEVQKNYRIKLKKIIGSKFPSNKSTSKYSLGLLSSCLPLHPITSLLIIPLFRSKVSQNERSLFSFLNSYEPNGFREFLENTPAKSKVEFYGLAHLYDYLINSLGMYLYEGTGSQKWSFIENSLNRLSSDAPNLTADIVKSIGLINLFGSSVGLSASKILLRSLFTQQTVKNFNSTMSYLIEQSIVIYRKHRKSYWLWEGSDLDINAVFDESFNQLERHPLHERLKKLVTPATVMARAHYIKTGNPRSFESRITGIDTDSVSHCISQPTETDGLLLFLVGDKSENELVHLAEIFHKFERLSKPVVIAVPNSILRISELIEELECWRWILDNKRELEHDQIARREVVARYTNCLSQFEQIVGSTLGLEGHVLDPSKSIWYFEGRKFSSQPKNSREIQKQLSRIFARYYCSSPTLRNELINRNYISSTSSAARRKLVGRILSSDSSVAFEINGFPPEACIFQSLLVNGGFIDLNDGNQVSTPHSNSDWCDVWSAIEDFVEHSKSKLRQVTELYDILRAPPFGLRQGPLPILIALVVRLKRDSVALYEDGVFVNNIRIEEFERLMRKPSSFALRCYRPEQSEIEFIDSIYEASKFLWESKPQVGSNASKPGPLQLVRLLIGMVFLAPPFTLSTMHLSGEAIAVRRALINATDPYGLLLKDLPLALRWKPNSKSEFTHSLKSALIELRDAYQNLLSEIELVVVESLGISQANGRLRSELNKCFLPLQEYTEVSSEMGRYVQVLAHIDSSANTDWREEISRVVMEGKPPTQWIDADWTKCKKRLRVLASESHYASSMLAAQSGDARTSVANIHLLESGEFRKPAVIPFSKENKAKAENLKLKISALLDNSNLDTKHHLIALAWATSELVQDYEEDAHSDLKEQLS